jgi:hypothetical protein
VNPNSSPAFKYQNCILDMIFCFHLSIAHPARNAEKCQSKIIFIFFGLSGTVPGSPICSLMFHRWSKLPPRFSSRYLVSFLVFDATILTVSCLPRDQILISLILFESLYISHKISSFFQNPSLESPSFLLGAENSLQK